jgi:Protein of unknown function (DUF3969)
MKNSIDLAVFLASGNSDVSRQLGLFALLNLGIVESLANGALSAVDATRFFYNAKNCQYVRKKLLDKSADDVMSHGVQLEDLFAALPEQEAQQEFQRELGSIRTLCLGLLDEHQLVA